MIKKKTVIWILLILGVLFTIDRYMKSMKTEQFDTVLINIDTNLIDAIRLTSPVEDHSIHFVKEVKEWIVSQGNISAKANHRALQKLLEDLHFIQVNRIVSNRLDKRSEYGVGKDQGVRIEIFSNRNKVEDFVIGNFQQENKDSIGASYIRLFGEKEIYAIEGLPLHSFLMPIEHYRNKELIHWPEAGNIKEITLQYRDTGFHLSNHSNRWELDEKLLDESQEVLKYLDNLKAVTGFFFADDFDETHSEQLFYQRLIINGEKLTSPMIINCYRDSTREKIFILHSNINPDAWFESDSTGLFQKIFKDLEVIIKK